MKGSDNRHPKQKETVEGDMYCGSSNSDGIRFKVHNMPDKSVMTPEDK
jgi:hypothetical protein